MEFLRQTTQDRPRLWLTGNCVEQYGASEADLHFLNAFCQLTYGPEKSSLLRHCLSYATRGRCNSLHRLFLRLTYARIAAGNYGRTGERMEREMGDCLNALTFQSPICFCSRRSPLADSPSANLIRDLGQSSAHGLLLIGTYRPESSSASIGRLEIVTELAAADQVTRCAWELGLRPCQSP